MVSETVNNNILEIQTSYSALRDYGHPPLDAVEAIRRVLEQGIGDLTPNMYEIDLTPEGMPVVSYLGTEIIENNNNMIEMIRHDEIDVRHHNEYQLKDLAMDKTIQYFHEIDLAITSSRHHTQGADYVSLVETLLAAQSTNFEVLRKVRTEQHNRPVVNETSDPQLAGNVSNRPVRQLAEFGVGFTAADPAAANEVGDMEPIQTTRRVDWQE